MTTIFYDGVDLYADRRIVYDVSPSRTSDDGIKIFINKENTIAMAVSGTLPSEKKQDLIFNALRIAFKLMYAGFFTNRINISDIEDLSPSLKDLDTLIAITNNKAIVCREKVMYNQTGKTAALGSGTYSILGCHYVLRDIPTAFRVSSEIDSLSSSRYTYVLASTLNPYVME